MPFCVCLGLRDYQLHVYAAESGKTGEERCPRFLCPPLATCLSSQPYEFPVPASDRCARLLAALGSGGCMAQRPSHLRHDHRRARRKKRSILINKMWNEHRVETYRWYVFFIFVSVLLFFLPAWATGGVKDLFVFVSRAGPGRVGVGFTNLGKSHYRTPGFWIGKYQSLR